MAAPGKGQKVGGDLSTIDKTREPVNQIRPAWAALG